MSDVGIVIIGRNEGERLRLCLASSTTGGHAVVYVDSGSTDRSIELARSMGASVVPLDLSTPFTSPRARNAGAAFLLDTRPDLPYIQFVDGDCELSEGWIDRARRELESHPDWAVVCGRLRERHPERSVYNRLAGLEWDGPLGEIPACGGIAMMRAAAFREAGGFDPTLIAGGEPELCLRLRRRGWRIVRVDAEMARHDIAMTRFGQWWRRAVRSGHAYAEGAARHGRGPERYSVREVRGILFWGTFLPLVALGAAWPSGGISLALLIAYPVQYARIRRRVLGRGFSRSDARLYALACLLAKFPQTLGILKYWAARLRGRRTRLIEYKAVANART
jgi:GT2 family glycosyltransferase